jgi:hypothetical protein
MCNFGAKNVIPNSANKSYIILHHNTYHGNIGANFPNPECAFIMANLHGTSFSLPGGFYNVVVKYAAVTNPTNSLRYDIGTCVIDNNAETNSGTNTFSPLLSILHSGNVGIGVSNPQTKLDVDGKININNISSVGAPSFTTNLGGNGDKIILKSGTASTTYPYSIGINTNDMWYSIPSGSIHNFYINSNSILQINSSGVGITGTLNATTIQEAGTSLASKYLNSNILPNLNKKSGFVINCSNAVTLSGTSYFKYDINLSSYTKTMYLDGATSNLPYRTFSIKCLPVSGIFSSDGNPNIAQYDIYMSSNISAGTSNLCAIGVPQNVELNQIPVSSSLFLLETTIFNYISVISTTSANINCIIEDYLN